MPFDKSLLSQDSNLVAVTGANGYVGLHIVDQLLRRGQRTRAIVRSAKSAVVLEKQFAKHLADKSLEIAYVPDILAHEHVYDDAFKGATAVIHAASPIFSLTKPATDPEVEFYQPAEKGALHGISAAHRTPTVKRFVLTSSVVATFPDKPYGQLDNTFIGDIDREQARKFTDARLAYRASKTFSEKAVWSFIERVKPSFQTTVLLPGLVGGRSVDPEADPSEGSNSLFVFFASSPDVIVQNRPLPQQSTTVIDVHDVANAHVNAALAPESYTAINGKRFFIVQDTLHVSTIASVATSAVPEWPQLKGWSHQTKELVENEAQRYSDPSQLSEAELSYRVPSSDEDAKSLDIYPLRDFKDTIKDIVQPKIASS